MLHTSEIFLDFGNSRIIKANATDLVSAEEVDWMKNSAIV